MRCQAQPEVEADTLEVEGFPCYPRLPGYGLLPTVAEGQPEGEQEAGFRNEDSCISKFLRNVGMSIDVHMLGMREQSQALRKARLIRHVTLCLPQLLIH